MGLNVGIIGAGMGGLATAAYLARAGHQVRIFDQFDAPKAVGSGLVVQPAGQRVLAEIGAFSEALRLGTKVTAMAGYEVERGRKVLGVDYRDTFGLAIHRASLFHALLQAADAAGATLETSAKITAIEGQHLRTKTMTAGPFDLIVNASGANATLSPLKARALPYGALWGTVPWPKTTDLDPTYLQQRYKKASRMVGILPVGCLPDDPKPVATFFWSLRHDGFEAWKNTPLDQWKAEATRIWPEMAPFLDSITDHAQMTHATYSHGALLKPVRGRLVHLGDAAHRTSPQLGQGANMALLDAAALSRALRDPDLDIALLNYTKARRAHVWLYQLLSAAFTPQYQSDSDLLPWLRDHLLFPLSEIPPVPHILTKLVCGEIIPPLGSLPQA